MNEDEENEMEDEKNEEDEMEKEDEYKRQVKRWGGVGNGDNLQATGPAGAFQRLFR